MLAFYETDDVVTFQTNVKYKHEFEFSTLKTPTVNIKVH